MGAAAGKEGGKSVSSPGLQALCAKSHFLNDRELSLMWASRQASLLLG